jgi:hypothetical protein
LVTSLYPGSIPLTEEQQDALAVATAFPETSLRFLDSNIGKSAFFLNSWARHFNSNRYSASRKISPSLSLQQINQQLLPSWNPTTDIMPRGRKRKYNVSVRPGAYGRTVQSDGQYRYGLGRQGRNKLNSLKDLYAIPDTHCKDTEEVKYVDVDYTIPTAGVNIDELATSTDTIFARIANGTAHNQRIGNKILLLGCHLKADLSAASNGGQIKNLTLALELWYDSQANGAGGSAANVYESTGDFHSHWKLDYVSRYYPIWTSGDVNLLGYSPIVTGKHTTVQEQE